MCSDNHSLKQEVVHTKEIRTREVRLESSIPDVHMLSQVDDFPVPLTAESKKALNPQYTEGLLLKKSRIGREWVDENTSVLNAKPISLLRSMRLNAFSFSKSALPGQRCELPKSLHWLYTVSCRQGLDAL